ncbi:hypothetical protein Zmor_018721 [Zophobas morio]|uniref:Peptidase S1 domain-containing protein n=1 Tax=Zophobas morio TaxID=2755281 RepID=A0AA38ICI2_9CUCU|nr:hypothetical protein Zmor_018721 [Zophobas morio]
MLRFALLILCVAAAALAMPAELPLLPGAVPAASTSKYLPFREISNGRIISGSPASRGQFPWQAGLYLTLTTGGTSFCGGALISSTWILTAAHCVQGVTAVTAYLGVTSLSDTSRVTAQASRAVVHPSYSSTTLANDIALLQLSTSVSSSSYISTISLATSTLGTGVSVTVSGWGRTSDSSSSISQTLNYVGLTTISNTACGTTIQSTCNGDSGGPLITGSGSSAVHVGIVSFGHIAGCAKGYPSAYTRTAAYRSWISSNAGV